MEAEILEALQTINFSLEVLRFTVCFLACFIVIGKLFNLWSKQ